jgi:ribosomal protein S12 methylthiotransferase accessory factor
MPVTSNIDDLLDAAPAARAYADALPPGRLIGFRTTGLDRLGVPAWAAVYMDGGSGEDGAGIVQHGMGFGLTDGEALVGAAGELAEYAHSYRNLARVKRHRGSYASLRRRWALGVVDPLTLCLPAGSKVGADTELEWVEARRYPSGEVVLVPIDVVAVSPGGDLSPGYEPFTTLIGNGLGAGPSLEFALAHGIGELLQRDGNGLAIRALATDVVVDLEGVEDPATAELLERIRAAGVEPLVKFCGDEFGVANVYAVGDDRGDGGTALPLMMAGAGEAAHPDGGGRSGRRCWSSRRRGRGWRSRTGLGSWCGGWRRRSTWSCSGRGTASRTRRIGRSRRCWDGCGSTTRDAGVLEERVFARGSTKPFGELPRWQAPAEADGGVPGKALCDELAGRLTAAGWTCCTWTTRRRTRPSGACMS